MKEEKEEKPKKKRRRRSKRHNVHITVDHYICTKCKKEHVKGITAKSKFIGHWILYREKTNEALVGMKDELPKPLPVVDFKGKLAHLDEAARGKEIVQFEKFIESRVVGQPQAIESFVDLAAKISAEVTDRWKPRGIYLLLGPTGVGKTRIVEAVSEYYFHSRKRMVKINCGELATMFSFKKFGGRIFSDENLLLKTKDERPLGLLLLDEIEKATSLLYKLLLGILDRGSLRVDEEEIDLRHVVVVMTSNLGANEIMQILTKAKNEITPEVRKEMHKAAVKAAQERFSPEFFNRLDEVIVFNPLLEEHLSEIIHLEVAAVEQRLITHGIRLKCSDDAIKFLIREGFDSRYGARHLKRTLERRVVRPIAHMIVAKELRDNTRVVIGVNGKSLAFKKVA